MKMLRGTLLVLSCAALAESFSIRPSRREARFAPLQMATASGGTKAAHKQAPTVKDPKSIRNVAFVGHSHCGKTMLVEWMLYDDKMITQKPTSGESSLDFDPIESIRHSSVFSHFARIPHRDFLLEVADTPWGDFPSDALASLDGADSAVLVVSAADGVQSGTVNAYQHCKAAGIKTIVALSKMDRPFVQVDEVLANIESGLGMKPVPLQVRLGEGDQFTGVEPLFLLASDGNLKKNEQDELEEAWAALEEAVVMTDDDLLVEYLETSLVGPEKVLEGLRSGVRRDKILPLVYTSAERDLGVSELMDAIIAVLPNPVEMREDALMAACKSDQGKCGMEPGVEAGFAARVLHTTVDSFGSLSVLRVITNSREEGKEGEFHSLPHEAVNLRTGNKFKMPSASTSFGLCGKERLSLADGARVIPGDVIAVPKLPEDIRTNDILTIPGAVKEEESEIDIETITNVLTPLSRPIEDIPLMAAATVSMSDIAGKKAKGRSTGADDKLISALAAMAREDLALRVEHDSVSAKLLLRCMSGDHLQLVASRLKDRFGLEVELGQPPVQYRETLIKTVTNVEGKHKKQSGGSGQFGVCFIGMEPLEEGAGIEFESQIKGGVISKPFIASVEKGVREELQNGGPLGYPVTDVRVTLTDGKMHTVDSKDIAFQMAGRNAVKAALEKGKTKLLQPMDKVTFLVDEKLQGEVSSIVARHDGYVSTVNPSADRPDLTEIEAILPTATIAQVSDALRAESAGEGQYTSVFSHYQPVPDNVMKDVAAGALHH